ncbi:hypothetical protein C5L38_27555 [Streptomyces sp. WAC00288]|uniref:hypothetical protein n=1 Tax=Streptomyces TaxID=1883 RepID=UPI0007C75041|nr:MULTISPECIES: hypothetical protein [unclassified Streptomyces]AVH98354.1 hypothetical protein C5L38_27555 [Streptomyces sp. WAC00288]
MPTSAFDALADRFARIPEGAGASAWTDFDEDVREALRWSRSVPPVHTWFPGTPGRRPTAAETAVALCGPDGRTREAALSFAGGSPGLLPLVVVRCADWAGPVRERARSVLRAELPGLPHGAFGDLLAVALLIAGRLRGDAARTLLTGALREGPESRVAALLGHGDRGIRRLAHRIGVERGLLSPARLAEIAATDPDAVVQDLCANAVLATVRDAVDGALLDPLLRSRQGRVRAAGVTGLRRAGRAAGAEPFLYDRSALVRACARWVLRQAGTEPLPLYRAVCAAGAGAGAGTAAGMPDDAPLGLAECGDRAVDVPALWTLTGHERPRVRASAVAGLRRLDAVRVDPLVPLLDDGSARVVREAVTALLPWADRIPADALLRRATAGPAPHVRKGALRLLAETGGAAFREAARVLADDPDPKLRALARRATGA